MPCPGVGIDRSGVRMDAPGPGVDCTGLVIQYRPFLLVNDPPQLPDGPSTNSMALFLKIGLAFHFGFGGGAGG